MEKIDVSPNTQKKHIVKQSKEYVLNEKIK